MAAPTQTLVLAGIILLNLVLAAAALYRRIRGRRRPRQHVPPPPPLEPAAAEEAEAEEEEGGGGERRQSQRRRRRARRKRQQQEEGAASEGGGGDGADGAAAKATGKEELLPRRPQFPLASVAGALQRRIHARYDDLARASEAQCLTIEQVRRTALPFCLLLPGPGLYSLHAFASSLFQCVCLRVKRRLQPRCLDDKCCWLAAACNVAGDQ